MVGVISRGTKDDKHGVSSQKGRLRALHQGPGEGKVSLISSRELAAELGAGLEGGLDPEIQANQHDVKQCNTWREILINFEKDKNRRKNRCQMLYDPMYMASPYEESEWLAKLDSLIQNLQVGHLRAPLCPLVKVCDVKILTSLTVSFWTPVAGCSHHVTT
jgi:hypothetical protein